MLDLKQDLLDAKKIGLLSVIDRQYKLITQIEEHYYILSVLHLVDKLNKFLIQFKQKNPDIGYIQFSNQYSSTTGNTSLSKKFLDKDKMPVHEMDLKIDNQKLYGQIENDLKFFQLDDVLPDIESFIVTIDSLQDLIPKMLTQEQYTKLKATEMDILLEEKPAIKKPKI